MTYTKETRLAFGRSLGSSWRDLAIQLEIPDPETERFPKGEEPDRIWVWLGQRGRLDELPEALTGIGRADLADRFQRETRPALPVAPVPWRGRLSRRLMATGAATVVAAAAVAVSVLQPWEGDAGARENAGLTAGGTAGASVAASGKLESAADSRCETDPLVMDDSFSGIVEQTWDVNTGKFVGVRSYGDPGRGGIDTEETIYAECATVFIRCQRADGREIKDAPWRDRPLSTRRWYMLTTPKPQWLPAMYVRVIPPEGRSAADVPACREG